MRLSRKSLLYRLAYFDGDDEIISCPPYGPYRERQRTQATTCQLFWRIALLPLRLAAVMLVATVAGLWQSSILLYELICTTVVFTED